MFLHVQRTIDDVEADGTGPGAAEARRERPGRQFGHGVANPATPVANVEFERIGDRTVTTPSEALPRFAHA